MTWVYDNMRQFYGYNWVGAKTLYPLTDLSELYDNKMYRDDVGHILYGDYDMVVWKETYYELNRTVREFSQEPESYVSNTLFLGNVGYFLTGEL